MKKQNKTKKKTLICVRGNYHAGTEYTQARRVCKVFLWSLCGGDERRRELDGSSVGGGEKLLLL